MQRRAGIFGRCDLLQSILLMFARMSTKRQSRSMPTMNTHKSHLQASNKSWEVTEINHLLDNPTVFISFSFLIRQAESQELFAGVIPASCRAEQSGGLALFSAGGRRRRSGKEGGNEVIGRPSLASNMLARGKYPSPTVIVSFILRAAIPPGCF